MPRTRIHIDIYKVTVPYWGRNSIEKLVAAGKYDWVNGSITDDNFPQEKTGVEEVEIELVHFNRDISTDNVLSELDRLSLLPANPAELLAFGAVFPNVQRKFPIVALGQYWRNPDGYRYVVCLDEDGIERGALLNWIGGDWDRRCRFAGLRK